jgi:acetyl coenzyme A synthetase (ADP forming)-like protein
MVYPAHLEADVVLRTGRTLRIRPLRHGDETALRLFFENLSPDALRSRFFDVRSVESAMQSAPVDLDYDDAFGLVGELNGAIAGVAHYFRFRTRRERAEVAFTIADRHQGCGVGTRLLERLADVARSHGVKRFEAETLVDNRAMLAVFSSSGFETTVGSREGVVLVTLDLSETAGLAERHAARAQTAAAASMKPIFEPRSIAVAGAGRRRGNLGGEILRNLRGRFRGDLFAVNPHATEIDGTPSYPSVSAIGAPVDLVVIAVPAAAVEAVIDDCVAAAVPAVVVISAGFGETGREGRELEQRILGKARASGMRMVGPNCMGVINTDPDVAMQATFASVDPARGNIAMSSQSGAIGLAVLDYARTQNVGFSSFISVGNKADVSGNDLIQYWAEDPATDVMLLYLESFGNPRKFAEIARRVSKNKPIVAVKAGRSAAGARAAQSHTGALASSDAIVADLFRQAGVIRTDTLEEMFDVASLLAQQPLPAGRRVGIITNAGGAGILAADACEARGLHLPALSNESATRLREFLPAAASVSNPVDMIASASAEDYRRAVQTLLADDAFDALLVIYIPVLPTDADAVAAALRDVAAEANGRTILATYMGAHDSPQVLCPIPAFGFPERAVAALAHAATYAEWRRRPIGEVPQWTDINEATVRAALADALTRGDGWLEPHETTALLDAVGIRTPSSAVVGSADEARAAALGIGGQVVLKALGPTLLHKTEAGAVRLGLDADEAADAFIDLRERLGEAMTGALVQEMIGGGVEVMIGATDDPTFGHVVAYGAGGTLIELLRDVAFRLHPLTDAMVDAMVDDARITKLVRGFRGAKPGDIVALKDALLRVSALLAICPEVRELDINPLKVLEKGVVALDARVRVGPLTDVPPSRRVTY